MRYEIHGVEGIRKPACTPLCRKLAALPRLPEVAHSLHDPLADVTIQPSPKTCIGPLPVPVGQRTYENTAVKMSVCEFM